MSSDLDRRQIAYLVTLAKEHARAAAEAREQARAHYENRRRIVQELLVRGLSYGEIGRELNLTRSGVQGIVRNRDENSKSEQKQW